MATRMIKILSYGLELALLELGKRGKDRRDTEWKIAPRDLTRPRRDFDPACAVSRFAACIGVDLINQ